LHCSISRTVPVLLVITLWSLHAHAAAGENAAQCAGMSDDHARLACYDSIFRGGGAQQQGAPSGSPEAAAQASAATGAAAPPARGNPQEDFGLTEAAKEARDPEAAARVPQSINGKVASVARRPTGEFVATLDNGQVWTQIDSYPTVRLSPGDTVTIKKASLGSFLLVTPSKAIARVRRMK